MIGKRGESDLAVAKIIGVVLAIVFLVIIVSGVSMGFDNLFNKVEGKFNEVLILLGIGGDRGGAGCCRSIEASIPDGTSGIVEVCRDKCTFNLTSPTELLGAGKFAIVVDSWNVQGKFLTGTQRKIFKRFFTGRAILPLDSSGKKINLKAWNKDLVAFDSNSNGGLSKDSKGAWFDVPSWGNDPEKSEIERKAFTGLTELMDELYFDFGNGKSKEEFFAPMEFDSNRKLEYVIESRLGRIVFKWDGTQWTRRRGKLWTTHPNDDEVFEELYRKEYQKKGGVVYILGEGGKGFKELKTKDDFRKRFDKGKEEWNKKMRAQKGFLSDLKSFLDNGGKGTRISFMGSSPQVRLGWMNIDKSRRSPIVYFELPNGEKFGLYYEGGIAALAHAYSGQKFEPSPINRELTFSDDEWEQFVEINKIYEFLRSRGCGI